MRCYSTLRRQSDFDRVFEHGRWRRERALALGVVKRHDEEPSRVAFVAGGRLGRAVRRNRARRRLREAFHCVAQGLKPGADIVVLARDHALDVEFSMLMQSLSRALAQAGLLEPTERSEGCGS